MALGKSKLLPIACFLGLFLTLYFGCDTKSPEQKLAEKSRAINFEKISTQMLLTDAKEKLLSEEKAYIDGLSLQLERSPELEEKLTLLEQMASFWFTKKEEALSGVFAQQIATQKENAESWAIAGTTYSLCIQRQSDADIKDFCFDRAVKSFEQAQSLEPDNVDHQINLALCYVEKPLEENPMKGIQMLLALNSNHPEDTKVLIQLGRLGIQTNQLEKAAARFNKVLSLEPDNIAAHCYLGQIYSQTGNKSLAEKHLLVCNSKK